MNRKRLNESNRKNRIRNLIIALAILPYCLIRFQVADIVRLMRSRKVILNPEFKYYGNPLLFLPWYERPLNHNVNAYLRKIKSLFKRAKMSDEQIKNEKQRAVELLKKFKALEKTNP